MARDDSPSSGRHQQTGHSFSKLFCVQTRLQSTKEVFSLDTEGFVDLADEEVRNDQHSTLQSSMCQALAGFLGVATKNCSNLIAYDVCENASASMPCL